MTLHLNVTREWFEMTLKGIKKDEYRDIKPHYISLLFDWKQTGMHRERFLKSLLEDDHFLKVYAQELIKDYKTITFSNGYATDRDWFVIEFKALTIIKEGKKEWGGKYGEKTFALRMGEIISVNNFKL